MKEMQTLELSNILIDIWTIITPQKESHNIIDH